MKKEKRCPKCGRTEKVKNGFNIGKQRYKCKNCEGIGFKGIERLLKVSHVSVINWVRKAAS